MEYPKFKVCCRCFTFNHSKYITDSMNGFTMQQTSFPFVCTIVDDASTDGEQEVIRKYVEENFDFSEGSVAYHKETDYAHITYAQHKNNRNCYFAVLYLKENHYSQSKPKMGYLSEWRDMCEYESPCEGDDYWIDTRKLQKQFDLMESYQDCTLCFHSIKEIYEGRHYLDKIRNNIENREYSGIEWYKTRPSQFASFFYRIWIIKSELYQQVRANKGFIAGDIPLLLTCAHYGKLFGISDIMSVYRHNETGWTAQKRTEEQIWKIIDSQYEYQIFGEEFKQYSKYFAQRECASYILSNLKHCRIKIGFIKYSLNISFVGFIRSFYKVATKQND